MTRRRLRKVLPALALPLALAIVAAWAFWSAPGAGNASVASATLDAAEISVPGSAINSVTVTWAQQASLQPDTSDNGAITYSVERKLDSGAWAAVASGGCSGAKPHGVTSCSDTPPASGSYRYRVVANYHTWTATSDETDPVSVTIDTAGPAGGSVDASGLVGTGDRYSTSTTLSIVLDKGSDPSGLASSGAQLRRSTATLTSGGIGDGSCGSYSASAPVGGADPATPVADTVPAGQACYRYEYVVADTVGNSTTYTSSDIKVDTTAPGAPSLAFSALTNTHWNSPTLFYRSTAASGAFTVTASATDADSGIDSYAFPTLPAGWTAAPGAFGVNTYSWSTPNPTPPSGAQNVSAKNNALLTSPAAGITLASDVTAPATGNVSYTSGYYNSLSVSVTFDAGTDTGGSGVKTTSGQLQRAQGALLAGGTCDPVGSFGDVGGANPSSPYADTTVAAGTCYQYRYLVSDNVGNQATYADAGIAKVDTTAPTISRAVVAKTATSTAGVIRQGGSYFVYAQVTDNASVSTVTANTSSFDAGITATPLTAQAWTVGGQTYNYRSGALTADTPMTTGATRNYTISATDAATNNTTSAPYSATIETYNSVINATAGLVSQWRFNEPFNTRDEFVDTTGTLLSSHTGEVGGSWTAVAGQTRTALISNASRLRKQGGTGYAQYQTAATPPSANYLVQTGVYPRTLLANDEIGVVGRQNAAGTDYYQARYRPTPTNRWELNRVVGGVSTPIGTGTGTGYYTQTLTALTTYELTLQMNGSAISLLVDGVPRITATDATITATGRGGVRLGTPAVNVAVSDTAGLHLENFRLSGLATDNKGTNHGTFSGGALLDQPGALVGDSNRAVLLDGTNDYVTIPDSGSLDLLDGPITLEAWVKRSGPAAGSMCLFDKGAGAYQFCYDANKSALLKNGGGAYLANSSTTVTDANWHHLVATKSGTATKLYIDGIDVTVLGTNQALANNALVLMLGRVNATGGNLAGAIDEFAIYNTVLSVATVLDHYNAGAGTG